MIPITKKTIKRFFQKLQKQGDGPSLIFKKLIIVDKFLTWAYQKNLIEKPIFKQIKEEIDKIKSKIENEKSKEEAILITESQKTSPSIVDFEKAVYAGEKKTEGIFGEISLRFNLQTYKIKSILFGWLKSLPLLGGKKTSDKEKPKEEKSTSGFDFTNLGIHHYIGLLFLLILLGFLGAGIYNRFFLKVERPFAYPVNLTRGGRVLSFQGRLTDSLGNPITTSTNVQFKLYNVSTGGTPLYTAGPCSIVPDQDGIFSVLIGSQCGAEIPHSVFTENPNIYLGVKVGADSEMTPRQPIANVGYAINAETLQGFPPGISTSNIPFINKDGNLLIAVANPGIRSTFTSADFALSSARTAIVQSAGTGDVVLQATESGSLKFRTGGTTDGFNQMVINNNGNVGIGTNNPNQRLSVAGTLGILEGGTSPQYYTIFQGGDQTGNITYTLPTSVVGGGFLTTNSSGVLSWTTTIPATSLKWNALTDPDWSLTLNHSTHTTTFNTSATTQTFFTINANLLTSGKGLYLSSTSTGLTGNLAEFVLSGSNAGNTGNVVRIAQTGTSSAAVPLMITNLGTGLSFRVNDETGDNDSTPFVIDASGNVGIGTTEPVGKFVIVSDTPYDSGGGTRLQAGISGNYYEMFLNTSSNGYSSIQSFQEGIGPAPLILQGMGGNVGIGTTAPQTKLDVIGVIRANNTNIDPDDVGAGAALGNIYESATGFSAPGIGFGTGSGNMAAIVAGSQTMYFGLQTGSANTLNTKMTLTSAGNLSINGNLTVSGGTIYNPNSSYRWVGSGNYNYFYTPSGYIALGPANTSWAHITTDRSRFYFNPGITVDTGIVSSYDEDLYLRRADTTKLTLGSSTATFADTITVNGSGNNYFAGKVGIGTTGPEYKLDVAGSFSGGGGNLVPESSFESSNKDSYWTLSRWGNNNGTWSIATDDYKYGNNSIKAVTTSYTDGGIYFCSPVGTSGIPVKPNTKYTYSYWVRSSAGETLGNNLYVYEYKSDGTYITEHSGGWVNPPTSWTRYSRTFTTTSFTAYVRLCAFYYNVGTFWWDGIQLEEGPTATQWKPSFTQKIEASNLTNLYLAGTIYSEGSGNNYFAGNVGIGTTNPSSFKLQVAGNVGPQTDNLYSLGSPSLRWANLYVSNIYLSGFTPGSVIFAGSSGQLSQNNSQFFWDNTNNRLAIGNNNFTAGDSTLKLEVFGSIYGNRFIDNNNSSYGLDPAGTSLPGGNSLFIANGAILAANSGNVGIGTTNPGAPLHIRKTDTNANLLVESAGTDAWAQVDIRPSGTGLAYLTYGTTAGNDLQIWSRKTGVGNVVRITADGKVGIGTTNPGAKLDVRGDITTALSGIVKDSAIQPGVGSMANDFLIYAQQNWLAYAHKRYTISSSPSKTWDNAFIEGDTYVSVSNTEVPITVTIDGITDFPYYSATYYHRPFVLMHGGYFQYIKVEVKDNTDTWITMQEVNDNTKGLWIGNRMSGFTAPIKGIRFTFNNPSGSTVYVKEIGIYHPNMEFTKYYVSRRGDILYGGLTFSGVTNDIITPAGEHLVLMPGGNVVIGNTTPVQKLDVVGNISLITGDQHNGLGTAPDGMLYFYRNAVANNQVSMAIDDDTGNVGIGTTAPGANLTVSNPYYAPKAYYTSPGTYSYIVPQGITSIGVKLWGAGGGAGGRDTANRAGGNGGGGAYAYKVISVTPGETLTVTVGGGGGGGASDVAGSGGGAGGYNGGAAGGNAGRSGYSGGGGGGGGRSTIARGATILAVAAGGGGGGGAGYNSNGGAGGGGGQNGSSSAGAGGVAGGSGSSSGTPGGTSSADGGGGGGGGAGVNGGTGGGFGSGDGGGGGGGGGTSSGDIVINGSGRTPGNYNDPDNFVSAGWGGAANGGSGRPGLVVIIPQTQKIAEFTASGNAILTILNSGEIGIKTTNPSAPLDVNGPIRWYGRYNLQFNNNYLDQGSPYIEVWSSHNAGLWGISAWASSARYKKNITNLEIDSNKIYDLRPVSFNWNSQSDSEPKTFGLIAEEVASILPELVNYDTEGKPWRVTYELISVLNLDQLQRIRKGLIVNSTGNVGIGTASPAYKLDVKGYVQAYGYYAGHIVENTISAENPQEKFEEGEILAISQNLPSSFVKANLPYQSSLLGLVTFDASDSAKPVIGGRFPALVSNLNGLIQTSDPITSSEIPGIGRKATKAGQIVGKALESTNHWSEQNCPIVSSLEAIQWPEDDGTNPKKPCFRVPVSSLENKEVIKGEYNLSDSDYIYVGKIMVFVNVSWYDPDVYLTSSGDLEIKRTDGNGQYVYNGLDFETQISNLKTQNYNLKLKTGELIERIGAFAEIVAAKIKIGLLETQEAIVNNVLVAKNIVAQNIQSLTLNVERLTASQKITSPVIETENIEFKNQNAKIKTATESATLSIVDKNDQPIIEFQTDNKKTNITGDIEINSNQEKGKLAQIILKGLEGKTAVVIDAKGNASFSGSLSVLGNLNTHGNATIAGTLSTNSLSASEASISGKIVAKEVEAENINEIQRLLAEIKNQPLPDLNNQTNLSQTNAINSSMLDVRSLMLEELTVTNQANLYQVSVSGSLLIGQTLFENNSIITLASELKLSALDKITLFDGAVTIAKDGTITTKGALIAKGGIRTNKISPLGSKIKTVLEQGQFFTVENNGSEVASIDASGSAYFKNIALEKFTPATPEAALIAASENFAKNGLFAPAIEVSSSAAGIGLIPKNSPEIVIYSSLVKPTSLIYLTPKTSQPISLSVFEKKDGYFRVVRNQLLDQDVTFDWLIIN